jgi:Putative zinc-finger
MSRACAAAIPFATLIDYWFDELEGEDTTRIEEHFLGCPACSAALEILVALGDGVRAAFAEGAVSAAISGPFLDAMKARGMRLREYPLASGESVHCTIAATDDAVVSRLKAPLQGVARVDLISRDESGALRFRLEDVPFDPRAGEVLFCPAATPLKAAPAHVDKVRLVAIEPQGERALGDYTFFHAPS